MSRKLEIFLEKNDQELQDYELSSKNIMSLSVSLENGEVISDKNCRVQIAISPEGMLGLGTELVRKAMRLKASINTPVLEMDELTPIDSKSATQGGLGVFLAHDSCSYCFGVGNLGTVEEHVEKASAEKPWE